eukprot:766653-Hanusia_phi.AAC.3
MHEAEGRLRVSWTKTGGAGRRQEEAGRGGEGRGTFNGKKSGADPGSRKGRDGTPGRGGGEGRGRGGEGDLFKSVSFCKCRDITA